LVPKAYIYIFFEQLELDYVFFSDLHEQNIASKISAASPNGMEKDKHKPANETMF